MYIYSEKKNKQANRLIALCVIYIAIKMLQKINWVKTMMLASPDNFGLYNNISLAINAIFVVVSTACFLVILINFIKFRVTSETKKLYSALLWLNISLLIINLLYVVCFSVFQYLVLEAFNNIDGNYDIFIILNKISQIYYYLSIFFPVPLYLLILRKEKLDINWMIVGYLTSSFVLLIGRIINGARNYLNLTLKTMTPMWFNQKYPGLAFWADSRVLNEIRSYFWIIGLLILVYIYKKNYKEERLKTTD